MSAHATPEQNSGQTVVKTWRPERQPHSRLAPVVVGWGSLIAQGTVLALLACGCSLSKDSVGRANDSSYESQAVDNPCVSSFDVGGDDNPLPTSDPPRTIRSDDPSELEYKDLSLDEAIQFAMSHSRVMRDLGGTILTAPDRMQTKYSSAMVTADPNFGIEGALSKFDPVLTASGDFEKNHRLFNNSFFAGGTNDLRQDLNVYTTQLAKTTAAGSQFFLRNNTDYNANNATANLFGSAWNTNIEAQVRQPLLQGAGTDFNRIAGPNGSMGNINGVLVARVNSKIGQIDFEIGLRDFVSNVVNSYWDLYFAYRDLDAKVKARDASLEVWQSYAARQEASGEDRTLLAQEQYLRLDEQVQNSLTGKQNFGTRTSNGTQGGTFQATSGVHVAERRLRLLMGMPITDHQLLRPSDEPKITEVVFDWDTVVCEAMTRRPELRRQKLKIQRREMELLATRNFLKPRLDVTGQYRIRGFGHDLSGGSVFDPNGTTPLGVSQSGSNAVSTLVGANYQEYQAGVEFSMALGMRQAHAAVHTAELTLARERVVLAEQERQVIHDLTNAKAEVDRAYSVAQTNLMRFRTTSKLVDLLLEKGKGANPELDRLLFAQSQLVNAESSFFLAQVEFEVAMKNLYYERNSLLDYYGMSVMDGVDDEVVKTKSPMNLMKSNSGSIAPAPVAVPQEQAPAAVPPAPAPAEAPANPAPNPADQTE